MYLETEGRFQVSTLIFTSVNVPNLHLLFPRFSRLIDVVNSGQDLDLDSRWFQMYGVGDAAGLYNL